MEKIDIRDCFPAINGGDGVILSRNGDICIGWEISLPPAFRCNEEKYDSIVRSFSSAIALLPDYSIVHKQDIFMKKQYRAADARTFLEAAYENHFDGREYLDHISRLFLVFSSSKNIKGGSSGLLGISSRLKTKPEEINRLTVAEYNVYERKLKAYRDWKNTIATEKKISREEERKEIAKEMKADNEPIAKIMKYTKLTEEEINQLCESGVKREL